MAQDVVVKESLTDAMVRDGAMLVQKLDETPWRPDAALWLYLPDSNAWRLLLELPDVSIRGPREAYTAVQAALAALAPEGQELALEDIGVVPIGHPLVNALRTALRTGPAIGRVRFSRNVIGGHFIDDALIYRVM